MNTDRVNKTKEERDYLRAITKKYKQRTLESPRIRIELISNATFQSNHYTISSLTSHQFLKENEPTSNTHINPDMLSESIFNSEEYQIKFNQYKDALDKKIFSMQEKLKEDILFSKYTFLNQLRSINQINNKSNPFMVLIAMMSQDDLFTFLSINKEIKTEVLNALTFEIQTFILNQFKDFTHKTIFDDYVFKMGLIHLNEGIQHKISILLIIQARIASKREVIANSFNLRYKSRFYCDKELMINSFTFEVKALPLQFWIMREYTQFHNDSLNKAYLQHVMQFALGDYAEFTINIFTGKGLLNIREFMWLNIRHYLSPMINSYDYSKENHLLEEIEDVSLMRYCELELLKSDWKDIDHLQNASKFKDIITRRFEVLFDIKGILFDDVGYYIFKIFFIAKASGVLGLDNEIGINVIIVSNDELKRSYSTYNEVKKNNLIFDRKNEIQMHIGDELVFYFSKNK